MTAAMAIESEGLTRAFGKHLAVDGIALNVPAGSVYGFLGPNGSGKTTTIRMILGLLRPTAGRVAVCGHDVAKARMAAARMTGALLEARATYDHLSGRENLDLTRRLLGAAPGEIERVLDLVDLRGTAARKTGHYSLGMRQRLGIARALLGRPQVLILDEPLNGLDPEGIVDMRRVIRDLPVAHGVTVFLSSHLLSEVQLAASHVGLMRDGRLILQGDLAGVLNAAKPDLFLRVGETQQALGVLAKAGFTAAMEQDGIVVSAQGQDDDAARLARLLYESGCSLIQLTARDRSLEKLYTELAEDRVAA